MSSLRERLLRHKKQEAVPAPVARETVESGGIVEDAAASSMHAVSNERKPVGGCKVTNEWAAVGGCMVTNEWGSFVLRRRTYPAGYRHGKYELSELKGQAGSLQLLFVKGDGREGASRTTPRAKSQATQRTAFEAMQGTTSSMASEAASSISSTGAEGAEDKFHERLLFIDTETTGLGLGAGNVPFMVGIGFYEGDDFKVEQLLIRHPGEEIAMLAYLQEKLRKHSVLISYNGKSFDWPIVKNRYIMNRMPLQAEPEGHIDFLYPSRSLWKHTLPSCRLGKVEEERLMVHREEDVPGSLAPALYFQYLAGNDPAVLTGVFVHNELDVLSLAGLAVHFAGVLCGRIDWRQTVEHGNEEWFRLGLWLDKVGKRDAAEATMDALTEAMFSDDLSLEEERAPTVALGAGEGSELLLPLARYYKLCGRYEQASRLWQRYIALKGQSRTASLEPYVELSMHYEHREKRWEAALKYAEAALDKLWQRGALKRSGKGKPPGSRGRHVGPAGSDGRDERQMEKEAAELEKRIGRLRKKASAYAAAEPKRQRPSPASSRRTKPAAEQLTLPLEQSV